MKIFYVFSLFFSMNLLSKQAECTQEESKNILHEQIPTSVKTERKGNFPCDTLILAYRMEKHRKSICKI